MIKLKIEIKEENNEKIEDFLKSTLRVDYEEEGINATRSERKASKLIQERLKLNEKLQIIDERKEKTIEDLLRLLKSL